MKFGNLLKKCQDIFLNTYRELSKTVVKAKVPSLPKNISSPPFSSGAKNLVNDMDFQAKNAFNKAFVNLIKNVRDHPVSKELEAKTGSSLVLDYGDLFSFMGFENKRNPVKELVSFLEDKVSFSGFEGIRRQGFRTVVRYKVVFPTRGDFVDSGKFNSDGWEIGNPWPYAIEEGIPGFQYYLNLYDKGRSLGGFQSDTEIRNVNYTPTPYISSFLNRFVRDLKGGSGFEFSVI